LPALIGFNVLGSAQESAKYNSSSIAIHFVRFSDASKRDPLMISKENTAKQSKTNKQKTHRICAKDMWNGARTR
jgi:hypothetical protein